MSRVAIVALSASLSLGCHSISVDPATGRYTERSFLMETRTVCRGGECTTCARGKRVAVAAMLIPAVIEPAIGLSAMLIGSAISAVSKPDDWCSGWPEKLEVPPAKPREPVDASKWWRLKLMPLAAGKPA